MVSPPSVLCIYKFPFFFSLNVTFQIIVSFLSFHYPSVIHAVADNDLQEVQFCPSEAIVDLSYAATNFSGFIAESGLYFFPQETVKFVNGSWRGCICDIKPCLAFCPPPNITKIRKTRVVNDFVNYLAIPPVHNINLTIVDGEEESSGHEERFHFVKWDPCVGKGAYFLEPKRFDGDEFYLLKNGSLFLPRRVKPGTQFVKDFNNYCLRLQPNDSFYTPRVCSAVKDKKDDFATVKYVGALFGVPFLIATIIVYSVLSELRNIHGTTLRCYLCCLVVTYIALAADRIPPPDYNAGTFCLFLGFTIYFSFLASFLWLNVMCFDMWWRLGGFGSLRSSGKHHDSKKFIGYSIYAWGSAIILTAICIGMEFTPGISNSVIIPGFRSKACWFSTKTAAALYFFGPVGVIIACNIFLFISTSIQLVQHKKDTQRCLNSGDSRRHDDNKQWFSLHLKLSIVMGISWSTEVISWLWEDPKYLWYVTDMVNALQGFLIFIIFVWKKKIWQSLKKRYKELEFTRHGCTSKSPNSADSPATTACSDDSTVRCSISVLTLDERKLPEIQNTVQQSENQDPRDSRRH